MSDEQLGNGAQASWLETLRGDRPLPEEEHRRSPATSSTPVQPAVPATGVQPSVPVTPAQPVTYVQPAVPAPADGATRALDLPRRRDLRGEGYPPPPLGFSPPGEGPRNLPRLSVQSGWQAVATAPRRPQGPSLRVDWPMCRAHGICAEVLPEAVHLDEWGYPVVDRDVPLEGDALDGAKRAVQACPTLALRLTPPKG